MDNETQFMRELGFKRNGEMKTIEKTVVKGGWQHKLKHLLNQHAHLHTGRPGTASYKTRDTRVKGMFLIFTTLTKVLKYGIEDPVNLKQKHVEALVKQWTEVEHLAPATIEQKLTLLRLFCTWVGKVHMIRSLKDYAPEYQPKTYAAKVDRSPSKLVNVWELWDKVRAEDLNVAMQLLAIMAFGLRAKEAINLKPLIHIHEHYVHVLDGSKGGRQRTVDIDTDFKRDVAGILKDFVKGRSSVSVWLGNPNLKEHENRRRFYYVLGEKCGVNRKDLGFTAHSFRQDFACAELERRGLVPTVRGGSGKVMRNVDGEVTASKTDTELAFLQVAELLGHSRKSVMTAYAGPMLKPRVEAVEPELVGADAGVADMKKEG